MAYLLLLLLMLLCFFEFHRSATERIHGHLVGWRGCHMRFLEAQPTKTRQRLLGT